MTATANDATNAATPNQGETDLQCWQLEYWRPLRPPKRRRPIWCALIGLFAGAFVGVFVPSDAHRGSYVGHYRDVQADAIQLIKFVCIGTAIGFAIELFAEGTWPKIPLQFRLQTLLAICYIIAVVVITMRNYLILRSL